MSESDAQNRVNASTPRIGEIGRTVARGFRGLAPQIGMPTFADTLADATQARTAPTASAQSSTAAAAQMGSQSGSAVAGDGQQVLMAAAQATPTTPVAPAPGTAYPGATAYPGVTGAPGYPASPPAHTVTGAGTSKDPLILPYGATTADVEAAAAATVAARATEIKPLNLKEYPRPERSDRNGVLSWSSTTPPAGRDLDRFVDEARHRRAGWVTFEVDPGDVPRYDEMIERLTGAGIQPIARIQDPYGDLPPEEVKTVVKDMTNQGVRYFQLFDGPNLKSGTPDNRVDVRDYAERWTAAARAVVESGGLPGIGALAPNGDYDDRGFMRQLLSRIKDRGGEDVLGRSWLALRAEQPGATAGPSDVSNLAERAEWFDRVSRNSLDRSIPILATLDPAGRAERLPNDPAMPNADAAERSERTIRDLRGKAPFLFGVNRGTVESARP